MAEPQKKCTPSKRTNQPPELPHHKIVSGVRKIIAQKFSERELIELRSYINGLLQVASKSPRKEK